MIPVYAEDDTHYFDYEAAERPIRFAAKLLTHYEGRFAGQPFVFLPWQERITRNLFGWKRRADGLRRFRELYLLTAKGSGKTPWLAAIGMYMLLADGEAGAHVISSATDFQQAFLTLDAGKKYVRANAQLETLCDIKQFEIAGTKNSKWTVMSGTAEGRHGFRPSCLLMDEAHEWPNAALYNNLTANTPKRSQPLTLVATNAGQSEVTFCWKLHQRALAAREHPDQDSSLLPVIYETPEEMDWQSEAAAAAANPSLGSVVKFEQLQPELTKAKADEDAQARYRRLYLSQWQTTGAGRWLDMALWTNCEVPEATKPPDKSPLYVGLDLSESDDLCAATWVNVTPDRMYVGAHFWMPKATAEKYAERDSIPYLEWAEQGSLTLLDSPTVNSAARRAIAAAVIARGKLYPIKAVCYDRYKADETVAALEAASLTCVPIAQGYSLSPGCNELESRIKEKSISIQANSVLRFCAGNVEVKVDDKGNLWPVKPNAKGKYAGKRSAKIDGISALVTALVEARKASFPKVKNEVSVWSLSTQR